MVPSAAARVDDTCFPNFMPVRRARSCQLWTAEEARSRARPTEPPTIASDAGCRDGPVSLISPRDRRYQGQDAYAVLPTQPLRLLMYMHKGRMRYKAGFLYYFSANLPAPRPRYPCYRDVTPEKPLTAVRNHAILPCPTETGRQASNKGDNESL